MAPELDRIILEQLRIIGGLVDVIYADIGDVKRRISMVEGHAVGMGAQLSDLNARVVGVADWLDRVDERLVRVEPRRDTTQPDQQDPKTAAKQRGTPPSVRISR